MYYGPGNIRLEEVSPPRIGDDEILVEMKACGICGSDLMDWYLERRVPLVLGHETAGIIAEKGKRVREFDVGERVFVHHHVADMTCHFCRNGAYTLCRQFHRSNIEPGGFAQYFRVPAPNLQFDTLAIPKHVSFEEATLIEPVGCCIRALDKCRLKPGDSIAIIGAGPTGLIHTALSRIYGASQIIVSDLVDFRLDFAKDFGANSVINPKKEDFAETVKDKTENRGVDIAMVTAPNVEAYKTGISVCRKGGTLCVFAPTRPGEYLRISPKELFFSEIQIIPSYSTSHLETRMALRLIESGRIKARGLITHRYGLENVSEAFKTALEGTESLKVIILNM